MTNTQWSGVLDGYLKKNLDIAKKAILEDWDMVFVVDGYEGSGKSVLAQQMAKYCDPTIGLDRIVFTPKEFIEAIKKSKQYEAIIYDEAFRGMSSRAAMSAINRTLMSVLAQIRQKNLFVFIVIPSIFELDRYAAVWRSRALIHVYTKDNFKRGSFAFFDQNRKKDLYMLGKKYFSYRKPPSNFYGSFSNGYVVDEPDYRKKKVEALDMEGNGHALGKREETWRERFIIELDNNKKRGESWDDMALRHGLNRKSLQDVYNTVKNPRELRFGGWEG